MELLLKKLNYKEQRIAHMFNPPDSFLKTLKTLQAETRINQKPEELGQIEFVIAFVTKQTHINELVPRIAPKLIGDAILWMCYPKGSSKKYKCDLNRDKGWDILGKFNLESVRQVAIDEDWSALRFRRVEYIKTLKRKFSALSEKGRKKAGQ